MPKLILFDIDGTLVLTGGAGMRALNRAFEETFRVEEAFAGIPMPGRTDPLIVADALARLPLEASRDELMRFERAYYRHLRHEIHAPGPRKGIMPGVPALLEAMRGRTDVFLALLTGNFSEAARIKLEYFGLWSYFACGAYGEDADGRNGLVAVALARARACGAPDVAGRGIVIVGDTPLDIACARAAGARAIAVATGGYDEETLRQSGADVVFADLSDPRAFMEALDELP